MAEQLEITQDNFEALLAWLNSDRVRAGEKYEEIRQSLIKILTWRGCNRAEDLADEVISRVTRKVPELVKHYKGDPALYFYGVAKRVFLEYRKGERLHVSLSEVKEHEIAPLQEQSNEPERMQECLKLCLQSLSAKKRDTITAYYMRDKQAKIDKHKEMARQLSVAGNTLRVRAYRIRATLEDCIKRCLERKN